ncbi:MAG: hypothetical protein Kapaf2KO_15100 [Candidatus Kapaibacteriales bacterium]
MKILMLIILSILPILAYPQTKKEKDKVEATDNPLQPFKEPLYKGYLGLQLGMGPNIQNGDLRVNCESCLFDNGMGTGFTVSLNYDHYFLKFSEELSFGFTAQYDNNSFTAQYRELTSKFDLPVELQQRAEVDLHFVTLMPHIRYRPFEFISASIGIGPAFGSPGVTHTEELTSRVQTIDGRTYIIDQLRENPTLDDGGVPEGTADMMLVVNAGLKGYLWLRYDLYLTATVEWRQMLGEYDFYGSNMSITAPRFLVGVDYLIYRVF